MEIDDIAVTVWTVRLISDELIIGQVKSILRLSVVNTVSIGLSLRVPMTEIFTVAVLMRVLHECEGYGRYVHATIDSLHEPHLAIFEFQVGVLAFLLQDHVAIIKVKLHPRCEPP